MADLSSDALTRALPGPIDGVRWSVAVRDADTGALLAASEPDQVLRTASVGKVFLLVEAARALEAGEADADEPLAWLDDELVGDSGLWHRMAARTLPLVDLCLLTAAVSDNLATNVLVRRFGVDAVGRTAAACGVRDSGLLDRVRNERLPGMPPTLSRGNAGELSALMGLLHRREAVSAAVSERVIGWLRTNVDLACVASAFDLDALAHGPEDSPDVALFNKTGSIEVVQADVGVAAGPRGALAYAALAEWADGAEPRPQVRAAMGRLGAALEAQVLG